ncbi:MAG: hypothetical protein KME16_27510 [Scytolyngbya sp. HA4215-MV1]|nr:hypothetical protein [Scytolyngbya sp. HA4215-MV1]
MKRSTGFADSCSVSLETCWCTCLMKGNKGGEDGSSVKHKILGDRQVINKKEIIEIIIENSKRPITSETEQRVQDYMNLPRLKINEDLTQKRHKQAS